MMGRDKLKVSILTGKQGEGKTTLASNIVRILKGKNVLVGGILAPGYFDDGKRSGFDVLDIKSGIIRTLCNIKNMDSLIKAGPFGFSWDGILSGRKALDMGNLSDCRVVIIDEIGPLELSGNGWAECIDRISEEYEGILLIVVRESLIDDVKLHWFAEIEYTWDCKYSVPYDIVSSLLKSI